VTPALLRLEPRPGTRLVIVEDEGILALDLERSLCAAGFDVRGVATDAESALELVERERPDLVLMDIRLRGQHDGIETAAQLKRRFDVRVVYLTANGDPRTIERAQQTEPMGYLLKPFRKPDLINAIAVGLARVASERRLREREESLRATLACIGEAIVSTDLLGNVTFLNAAAERLAGKPAEALLGHPFAAVFELRASLAGAPEEDLVHSAQAHGSLQFQAMLARSGGQRAVAGTAVALRQNGVCFGTVFALRDLTELLLARQHLELGERLRSVSTLAAGVAHEVNNPLSVVISGLSFALSLDETLSPDCREALVDSIDAAKRVGRIVADLGAFSHPVKDQLRTLDPRDALGTALTLTRQSWRQVAGVVLDLQPVPAVRCSPSRLCQVFVNLLLNAAQAMASLTDRAHTITISSRTDARGWAVLTVADTGPGIAPEQRHRVFQPYFTTKPSGEGTGLGLAISRGSLERVGGRLELVEAAGGFGAAFQLSLPPSQEPAAPGCPQVLWVGEPTPELGVLQSQAQCRVVSGAEADLRELVLANGEGAVVLALDPGRARKLCAAVPSLGTHAVRAGGFPRPGTLCLRGPFDAGSLRVLSRHPLD
jgi:PAS domain S-box-containing protein